MTLQRTWVGGDDLCPTTDLERIMCAHCLGHKHDPPVTFAPWGGVLPNRGRAHGSVSEINDHTAPPTERRDDVTLLEYLESRIDPRTQGASPVIDVDEE